MISGASERELDIANAIASITLKLDNTAEYESWLFIQNYIDELNQKIDKATRFIEEHNKNAGKLYYKYNGRYLLSEIKEDLLEILGGKE